MAPNEGSVTSLSVVVLVEEASDLVDGSEVAIDVDGPEADEDVELDSPRLVVGSLILVGSPLDL